MGLRQIWECDRCGKEKTDSRVPSIDNGPPGGWQIIPISDQTNITHKLLCRECVVTLRDDFFAKPNAACDTHRQNRDALICELEAAGEALQSQGGVR
jgi:hypothetical protein